MNDPRSTRRALAALAITFTIGATAALAPPAAVAQDKPVIKLGWTTSDGATDPYAIGARAFKAAVERETKGAVEVQLFPNRALGDERQILEGIRFGTVDAGIITNAVIAQLEPAFQVNDLPFLYANEGQARKVLDGKVGADLAKRLDAKGIATLGYMEGGFRNMINNKRPVKSPDDVQGVKYRVMQNPVFIDMFNAMGGAAVPMAWGETFTAVQQGTIDGLEIPVAVVEANKYFEVTKFLSLTNHTYSMIGLLVSKRTLDKLSPELRKAVVEAGRAASGEQRQATSADADRVIANLKKNGMEINTVADVEPFRKSVAPVYDKFRKTAAGPLLDAALAETKP